MSNGIRRRRSIFSGLLLVAIGALFLWHNFRGGFEIWQVIGQWWPVVLILWGLAKLYDYWAAKQSGEAPPRTMAGGEVFLVLLLFCLAGTAGFVEFARKHPDRFVGIDFGEGMWGNRYSYTEEIPARAVKATSEIRVNTDRGDISVVGGDAAEIQVSVRKSAKGWEESEAKSRAESVKVVVVETENGYEVRPDVNSDNQRLVTVDLEVRVPKQATVKAKAERGDVKVSGVTGAVKVDSSNGDTEVHDIGADVTIEMKRGDVTVRGAKGNVTISGRGGEVEVEDAAGQAVINGEYSGPISVSKAAKGARFLSRRTDLTIGQLTGRFETGSGRLEITDATGSVQLETSSYDVVLEKVGGRIRVKNRNGNIEAQLAQAPKEDVELSTERGSIELSLPTKSSFDLSAEARRGDIEADSAFGNIGHIEPDRGGDSRLVTKVGQRGPQVTLRTSYGSIQLRKSD